MALNYKDEKYQGNYVYLPRIGEEATFEIKAITEVSNPKFNFKKREEIVLPDGKKAVSEIDVGYYIQAELVNGKLLSVTSQSAFNQVFKKHEINDGDTVKICHKGKGEWVVEKLK